MTKFSYLTCILSLPTITYRVVLGMDQGVPGNSAKMGYALETNPVQIHSDSSNNGDAIVSLHPSARKYTSIDILHTIFWCNLVGLPIPDPSKESEHDKFEKYNGVDKLFSFTYYPGVCKVKKSVLEISELTKDDIPKEMRDLLKMYCGFRLETEQIRELLQSLLQVLNIGKVVINDRSEGATKLQVLSLEKGGICARTDFEEVEKFVGSPGKDKKKSPITKVEIVTGNKFVTFDIRQITCFYMLGHLLMHYYSIDLSSNPMSLHFYKNEDYSIFVDIWFTKGNVSCTDKIIVRYKRVDGKVQTFFFALQTFDIINIVAPVRVKEFFVYGMKVPEGGKKYIEMIKEARGIKVPIKDSESEENTESSK